MARPNQFPEAFKFEGNFKEVNLGPDTLIKQFSQLRESQEMHDRCEVVLYNQAQRVPIESYWHQWIDVTIP